MCGIVGSINCTITEDTLNLIKHRGPDYQELVEFDLGSNKVMFGHTRLSILDVSSNGNQPMFTSSGTHGIIFNGEVYNHLELRKKLPEISFKGSSDTETILYYLKKYGIGAIDDFNGIFAFAYVDKEAQSVYLVRDHFGVKPLYYYSKGNKLIFGSELKVITQNPVYGKKIDTNALNTFLTFRYNPSPDTLFAGIKRLPASSYFKYNINGDNVIINYSTKKQCINRNINFNDALNEYQRLVEQAVKRQLLSDVPIGLLLSGGLDSAVLGHLMTKLSPSPIQSFTVGFEGKGKFNETEDARLTAKHIGSVHSDIYMNREQYMDYFFKSFFHTEEPIAEATIPALWYVSALAAKNVKVVLSGQGADETLGGYKRYLGEKFLTQYAGVLSNLPLQLAKRFFTSSSAIQRGIYSSQFKDELDRFVAIRTVFTSEFKEKLYLDNIKPLISASENHYFEDSFSRTDLSADSLSKMMFLDTRGLLPDNLLIFNDKLTMATSIENRVPFLDIDLVNFVESLPIDFKIKGTTTKYIHRIAAKQWLPISIIDRKKRAFETPINDWFKHELSTTLIDLIDDSASLSRIYFDRSVIKKMIDLHKANKVDYRLNLFIILSLELWYKNFFLN
jgi:asparagine synthase (glutamine-hydrolysing)